MQRWVNPASLKKKVAQVGRVSHKFSFTVHASSVEGLATPAQGLPEGAEVVLQIARGAKVVATVPAQVSLGKASWDAALEFVCTLYSSKKVPWLCRAAL